MDKKMDNEFERLQVLRGQASEWLQKWTDKPVCTALDPDWNCWVKKLAALFHIYINNIDFEDTSDFTFEQSIVCTSIEEHIRECIVLFSTVDRECIKLRKQIRRNHKQKQVPRYNNTNRIVIKGVSSISVQFLMKFKTTANMIILFIDDYDKSQIQNVYFDKLTFLIGQLSHNTST